ncbi:MAG: pseudouridine synthase, partial [Ignavibacteria bacterium]|nr:pseudouridine synthase [Ignavibacteria bacterium]
MMRNTLYYFAINKPYGMLSQFTDANNRKTLSELFNFPKDVYPIGRLDMDSEGLLLLTNDGDFAYQCTHPKHELNKTYEAV